MLLRSHPWAPVSNIPRGDSLPTLHCGQLIPILCEFKSTIASFPACSMRLSRMDRHKRRKNYHCTHTRQRHRPMLSHWVFTPAVGHHLSHFWKRTCGTNPSLLHPDGTFAGANRCFRSEFHIRFFRNIIHCAASDSAAAHQKRAAPVNGHPPSHHRPKCDMRALSVCWLLWTL